MPLRFGANLNFLFCENGSTLLERFALSRAAGFRGIEIPCPNQISKEDLLTAQKDNNIEVVLINIRLGKSVKQNNVFRIFRIFINEMTAVMK